VSRKIFLSAVVISAIFSMSGTAYPETLKTLKTIQDIGFPAGTEVEFYGSGQISLAELAKDQKIEGIDFAKGTRLLFYETGKLRMAILRREHDIQGVPCIGEADFYQSGKLKSALLSRDKGIQGLPFSKGSRITLLQSGKIQGGPLLSERRRNISPRFRKTLYGVFAEGPGDPGPPSRRG